MDLLGSRVEPMHLRQRLAIEEEGEAPVFGQGLTSFHIENWVSFRGFVRAALRYSMLYARGRRNALKIRSVDYDLRLRRLPRAFEGFRILQISDLHLDANEDFPHALSERVRGIDYDVCVLTGDYRYRTTGSWEAALDGLEHLCANLRGPVYAILGNHDSIRMLPAMEALGIRVLLNESEPLVRDGETLHLAGVDDPHFFRADNLERTCRDIPDGQAALLLSHSPELFRQAAAAGFDAMLCGHTHGGQIRLPGGIPLVTNANCPRKYCAGGWSFRGMSGYTSLGAGSSVVDVRFNCPPEVVVHRLTRASA